MSVALTKKQQPQPKQLPMRKNHYSHLHLYFVIRVGIHEAPNNNTCMRKPSFPLQHHWLWGDGLWYQSIPKAVLSPFYLELKCKFWLKYWTLDTTFQSEIQRYKATFSKEACQEGYVTLITIHPCQRQKELEIFEDEGFWSKLPACCVNPTRRSMGLFAYRKCKAKSFKGLPRDWK